MRDTTRDQEHGGIAPELEELEHDCVLNAAGLCTVKGVLCHRWLAGEWPFDDDPPDPL
jgi:hypothetical protein